MYALRDWPTNTACTFVPSPHAGKTNCMPEILRCQSHCNVSSYLEEPGAEEVGLGVLGEL